jgi:hypothetical protein
MKYPWSAWCDKEGNSIGPAEWGRLHTDDSYRVIGYTDIAEHVAVSTVWIGINMNFSQEGPPIIFETMIFGGPLDSETWRYATEREAKLGHMDAVRLARTAARAYQAAREAWEEDGDAFRWLPEEK